MTLRRSRLGRSTRTFWRVAGRPVDLRGDERWLAAPMHHGQRIADGWLTAAAQQIGGSLGPDDQHAGLNPVFQPGGELISRYFGRRVQQLALPTKPLEVALGIDSRVVSIVDAAGEQQAAGWIRTLRSTGDHVYSGCYSTRTLPRPRALPDGALELSSPAGAFGCDGAYVVVQSGGRTHAARAPIHETFRVYVDLEGVLRTDHRLCLWSATVVRLHYKLLPLT